MFTELQCYVDPCMNGGTCFEEVDGSTCVCPSEWTGGTCNQGKSTFMISKATFKTRNDSLYDRCACNLIIPAKMK